MKKVLLFIVFVFVVLAMCSCADLGEMNVNVPYIGGTWRFKILDHINSRFIYADVDMIQNSTELSGLWHGANGDIPIKGKVIEVEGSSTDAGLDFNVQVEADGTAKVVGLITNGKLEGIMTFERFGVTISFLLTAERK